MQSYYAIYYSIYNVQDVCCISGCYNEHKYRWQPSSNWQPSEREGMGMDNFANGYDYLL